MKDFMEEEGRGWEFMCSIKVRLLLFSIVFPFKS